MKIIVDAFGGDHAPKAVLEGCAMAVAEYGVEILLTGDREKIERCAAENQISLEGITIEHAPGIIPVEADPTDIRKKYADCSLAVGLQRLADHAGDAFVSAGSTGALVVGASLMVGRIKGIKRAAIGTVIPTFQGCYLLLDGGANAECRPEMLQQFAVMGSAYMEALRGISNPRVGLINIGTEPNKGTSLQVESYRLLQNAPIHFIGNVEPRELPGWACDVAVADGFTGNVVLKLTEGVALSFAGELKRMLKANTFTMFAALLMRKNLQEFKKKMDYTEHGGAPLMGIAQPVIKAHGSSNAKAFKNAIRQARDYAAGGVIDKIETALAAIKAREKMEKSPSEQGAHL
ncbi:MAG: phosphate acyltransferase PlsX [Provencibacterium sp.]|jgi:glycerol-3-phosphate acyltransferase PlsX|nr:phosphate acyltransferase PlsX [Provencibacterium sp.]